MPDPQDTIAVRSGRTDNRIVLWDVDDAHPEGEVKIAADFALNAAGQPVGEDRSKPTIVGLTAAVTQRLASGELVRVSGFGSGSAVAQAEAIERNTGIEPQDRAEVEAANEEAEDARHRAADAELGRVATAHEDLANRERALVDREAELERRERALADSHAAPPVAEAPVAPVTDAAAQSSTTGDEDDKAPHRSNRGR